jgi:hypothetical protein
MTMPPRSREDRRQRVEDALGMIDPRASREAAWEAVERGFIDPDLDGGGVNSKVERFSISEHRRRRFR